MAKDQLEAQIKREVMAQSAQYASRGIPEEEREALYFNNFHLNLPGGGREDNLQDYLDDPRLVKSSGQTLRQFFADMHQAVEISGVADRIKELQPNA